MKPTCKKQVNELGGRSPPGGDIRKYLIDPTNQKIKRNGAILPLKKGQFSNLNKTQVQNESIGQEVVDRMSRGN